MTWLWSILVGIAAGFLAGLVMQWRGVDIGANLIVGVIGALLGGFLLGLLGVTMTGLVGNLISPFIGTVVLLFLNGFIEAGRLPQADAVARRCRQCDLWVPSK